MLSMIGAGMLKKTDMEVFSEELRNQIGFAFEERK
jgi:hypothetical protein